MSKLNKILVIGSGGREHAMIRQLKQSTLAGEIFCIPGNAGIATLAKCITDIAIDDSSAIINFCQQQRIDLVVIGSELPLVLGLVDDLTKVGIKAFGPSKLAARLEGSKAFTKKICDDYNIPTACYQAFNDEKSAIDYLDIIGVPCVIKADGIAAGKGVIIARDETTATEAIKEIFSGRFTNKFDVVGATMIIEEFLEGVEVSFFALCDGKSAQFLGSAGDHKKVGEGDIGANTGGMGTYSPSPFLSKALEEQVMTTVIKPTLQAMNDLGCPFVGILFAGLILTKDGPKLLEFNVRFGDPETQSLLPRLKSDLLELILATLKGDLLNHQIEFDDQAAVCVVMASKGYPENYQKNTEIKNLSAAEKAADKVIIFHAGTALKENKILAVGGRVLGITALADSVKQARIAAYKAVDTIDWNNGFCRRDIGLKAE